MSDFHLAQINYARLRAPLEDPSMADFVAGLTRMNELADRSPGFVWRLVGENGDGTVTLADPRTIFTLSVWESVEDLRAYAYHSEHLDYLRRRREWFLPHEHSASMALWWIPAGRIPTLRQGVSRLGRVAADGPTAEAFTLRKVFSRPEGQPVPLPARPA